MASSIKRLLNDTHLDRINSVIKSCQATQQDIDRCKRAQIPCEQLEMENQAAHEIAKSMKAEFFPEAT
jgi:hypothetical protein